MSRKPSQVESRLVLKPKMRVAKLPNKPKPARTGKNRCKHRLWPAGVRADGAQRQTDQVPGRSDVPGVVTEDAVRESITARASMLEVGVVRSVVAMNRGNAWGAKGSHH